MPLQDLNHVNLRAPKIMMEQIKDFYVDVLGLTVGPRPNINVPGYWLCLGDRAVVHLMVAKEGLASSLDGGLVDHIAFTCSDIEGMEASLISKGVQVRRNDLPDFNISQLFVHDPSGFLVELNFSHS